MCVSINIKVTANIKDILEYEFNVTKSFEAVLEAQLTPNSVGTLYIGVFYFGSFLYVLYVRVLTLSSMIIWRRRKA